MVGWEGGWVGGWWVRREEGLSSVPFQTNLHSCRYRQNLTPIPPNFSEFPLPMEALMYVHVGLTIWPATIGGMIITS